MIRIEDDDGSFIEVFVSYDRECAVVAIRQVRESGVCAATIWLTPLQVDALVRALGDARVSISYPRPQ